jgi:hypothetical protein
MGFTGSCHFVEIGIDHGVTEFLGLTIKPSSHSRSTVFKTTVLTLVTLYFQENCASIQFITLGARDLEYRCCNDGYKCTELPSSKYL